MSSLLRSVQIFPDLKGAHDPDLSYKKFDEVQHRTSIYVAAEDIPAGTEITDPRWVVKLDNSAAYAAEQAREEAEALRVAADAARMGFIPKGDYNPANENKYGEWYTHEGGSYGYIWPEPSTGVPVTDKSHWQQIASVGGQDLVDAAVAAKNIAVSAKDTAVAAAATLVGTVANGLTAKGASAYASLPTTGNEIGDYYYCSDGSPAGNYVWNGTAWYFGGTGDEGYSKLKGDISAKFDADGTGLNKCNPNTMTAGRLDYNTGTVNESETSFITSDFILIDADAEYIVASDSNHDTITYQRVSFFDSAKEFISSRYSGTSAVEIPENAVYVRVSNTAGKDIFVGFNDDGTYAGYEEYVIGKLKQSALPESAAKKEELQVLEAEISLMLPIEPEETTFFDVLKSTNLLPFANMENGRLVNGIVDSTQAYITTPFINIARNDGRYILPESSSSVIGCNAYAFYNADKSFISGYNYSSNEAIVIPGNAYFFRASIGSNATGFFVGISDTTDAIPYEDYYNNCYIKEEHVRGIPKNWYKGKKAAALGDSITANAATYTTGDGRTGSAWREFVAQELELADTIYNCGVGGSKVSGENDSNPAMWTEERINAIPEDTEVLFFNGGMNDWGGNVALGEEDSTDTNTFYGALNTIVSKLMDKFPTIPIFFMTTTYGYNSGSDKNSVGLTQYDYGRAIKKVAAKNGFPCIDLHALCGWNRLNISHYVNNEEGVFIHPNRNGGRKIAAAILSVVKQYQPCEIE